MAPVMISTAGRSLALNWMVAEVVSIGRKLRRTSLELLQPVPSCHVK